MTAWKDLERSVAKKLGGVRLCRGDDFAESTFDVAIPDMAHWKIDAKHRTAGLWHHTRLAEIRRKYCRSPLDVAILVTKQKSQHGEVVSLSLDDFAELLGVIRLLKEAASKP